MRELLRTNHVGVEEHVVAESVDLVGGDESGARIHRAVLGANGLLAALGGAPAADAAPQVFWLPSDVFSHQGSVYSVGCQPALYTAVFTGPVT